MTSIPDEAGAWQEQLARHIGQRTGPFVTRVVVAQETPSTQDECRRLSRGEPGLLVTACRQTAGRGRLGRSWVDAAGHGIALTLGVPAVTSAGRLSIAAGLSVCQAVATLGVNDPKIRWPNDVLVSDRKLAGVLIEQSEGLAFIGIGLNVSQTSWPPALAPIALSLRELGIECARISVVATLIDALNETLTWNDARLVEAFARHDALRGTRQVFESNGERITGTVIELDPLKGLSVATERGPRFLPAETTSLVHDDS